MYEIIYYTLAGIMMCVCGAWAILLKSMMRSFSQAPYLDVFEHATHDTPMVSVILPARDEEKFIKRCLESLVNQDYTNYEVIAVDDSSQDNTSSIIRECAKGNDTIVPVSARPKPEGWMGKNWACTEGYKKARGEILMFTDADTIHSNSVISLAVSHMASHSLDAISAIPRMLALDFWTKAALPMICVFLHTRFSALNVNNPAKKTGYFFGSFFMMNRHTYDSIGTHEGVKGEVIEDGALGKKTKEAGFKMRMVRGEHLISAVWARDAAGLWNALKRLMVPLYQQDKKMAVGIFFAVAFLLFVPFPLLAAAILSEGTHAIVLAIASGAASALVFAGAAVEAKLGLGMGISRGIAAPLGGLVIVLGFLAGMRGASVSWRGRTYPMRGTRQDAINV